LGDCEAGVVLFPPPPRLPASPAARGRVPASLAAPGHRARGYSDAHVIADGDDDVNDNGDDDVNDNGDDDVNADVDDNIDAEDYNKISLVRLPGGFGDLESFMVRRETGLVLQDSWCRLPDFDDKYLCCGRGCGGYR
jgi:hypothetical protein